MRSTRDSFRRFFPGVIIEYILPAESTEGIRRGFLLCGAHPDSETIELSLWHMES